MPEALGLTPSQSDLVTPAHAVDSLAALMGITADAVRSVLDAVADLALSGLNPADAAGLHLVSLQLAAEVLSDRREAAVAARPVATGPHPNSVPGAPWQFSHPGDIAALTGILTAETTSKIRTTPGVTYAALDPIPDGVEVQVLCHRSAATSGELGAAFRVRVAATPPPTMHIFDQRAAIVLPAGPGYSASFVRDPAVIAALTRVFDDAWHAAAPLGHPTQPGESAGLAPVHKELLRLLYAGLTDEAAAARLGISLRTARRHMANLMKILGAASRFQAGANAASRGWLTVLSQERTQMSEVTQIKSGEATEEGVPP